MSIYNDENKDNSKYYITYVRKNVIEVAQSPCWMGAHKVVVAHILVAGHIDNLR